MYNLKKNRNFSNLYYNVDFYKVSFKKRNLLNARLNRDFIQSRYFSNLTNINIDNCLLNNQVKNLANTHFINLKNINLYFRNIKYYIKNLLYDLIKRRHTISGLFRVYCRRLN